MVLGLGLVVAISVGSPYSIWMVGSSEMTWSYFPIAVGAPLFILVLGNALLKRALSAAELITITIMGLVASGMPIFIVGLILSIISKPYYGALPTNEWAIYVHPHLPDWAIPDPAHDAMRFFYEGLPRNDLAIPWGAWAEPLLWWLLLVLAMYFVGLCSVVVLRRHWMERERLTFPLTEAALMLTEVASGSVLPPALKTRAFWVGFAIPCGLIAFNVPSYFFPGWAQVPIFRGWAFPLVPHAPAVDLLLYFPVLGFMYLAPLAISFSVWFFHLLYLVQLSLIHQLGVFGLRPDPFVYGGTPLSWQSWGAFAAMVGGSLWMARRHLAAVWSTALDRAGRIDDADEIIFLPGRRGRRVGRAGFYPRLAVAQRVGPALGSLLSGGRADDLLGPDAAGGASRFALFDDAHERTGRGRGCGRLGPRAAEFGRAGADLCVVRRCAIHLYAFGRQRTQAARLLRAATQRPAGRGHWLGGGGQLCRDRQFYDLLVLRLRGEQSALVVFQCRGRCRWPGLRLGRRADAPSRAR